MLEGSVAPALFFSVGIVLLISDASALQFLLHFTPSLPIAGERSDFKPGSLILELLQVIFLKTLKTTQKLLCNLYLRLKDLLKCSIWDFSLVEGAL